MQYKDREKSRYGDTYIREEDKVIFTKLLDSCYKYAVAINSHDHPFPAEPLIMSLLLLQHKLICHLKAIVESNLHILFLSFLF